MEFNSAFKELSSNSKTLCSWYTIYPSWKSRPPWRPIWA